MLTDAAIDRIRQSIEAELGPRSTNLAAALAACDSDFASHGAFNSSRRILQRGIVGCQELEVRADIIWALIQRCRPWLGEPDDDLLHGLNQQIEYHIGAQAGAIMRLTGQTSTDPQRREAAVDVPITECCEKLTKKFWSQARFFVEELRHPPTFTAPGATYNFNSYVGAVQTGAQPTAHVRIDAAGSARLIEALERLRGALPTAADMTLDAREQGIGLVSDIIVATRAENPNRLTLTSLLMVLGMTVRTVASLRPAWDAVRQMATLIGVHLP